MELETGIYIIRSVGTNNYIGRNPVEDMSGGPKHIVNLPEDAVVPCFFVERLPTNDHPGRYTILAMGGLVAEENELLWAFLHHNQAPSPTAWHINRQEQHGKRIYTVERPDHGKSAGWFVPDEKPETQVAVVPLIVKLSNPPQFEPQALFEFVRIERGDDDKAVKGI